MYLGIDIGTSAVKTVLIDVTGTVLSDASVGLSIQHPHAGWAEQAPDDWWQAVVKAVRSACADQPPPSAIGLSGQMHGAVLLDKTHKAIRPAILWNDSRAEADCNSLSNTHPHLAQLAGVRAMPGLTAPKLLWLSREEPNNFKAISHLLSAKDYIGLRLHGACITDPSDAAATWWFDQAQRDWAPALQTATASDPGWFPPILGGDEQAGQLSQSAAEQLGLPRGIPIATGAGDAVAGAIALGAVRDGDGFVSLGTSGQLFVVTDRYAAAPDQGLHSFAHTLPGLWYQMAAMLNGARPMQWFADMTGAPIETLLAEAQDAPLPGTPICLPYLTGERTPHGDSKIRSAFIDLSNDTTRGQMMRAVIEAIAYSFADARAALEAARPMPCTLQAIGGGARSALLLQTMADVIGVTLNRSEDAAIGPAIGAAKLAAMCIGDLSVSDLHQPETRQEFRPDPEASARHESRLRRYRALYPALQSLPDA